MSSGMPELGSKISLISKADIRYEGRLFTVDPQECTIALASVRSFGTEDRETQFPVAPQNQVYDYILFRGSDIKDIRVVNNVPSMPNDPAIMQLSVPASLSGGAQQYAAPQYQHPVVGPAQYAPYHPMGGLPANVRPVRQPSELATHAPEMAPPHQPQQPPPQLPPQHARAVHQPPQVKDQGSMLDLIGGNSGLSHSRSVTPSATAPNRKSPTADQGTQVGPGAGGQRERRGGSNAQRYQLQQHSQQHNQHQQHSQQHSQHQGAYQQQPHQRNQPGSRNRNQNPQNQQQVGNREQQPQQTSQQPANHQQQHPQQQHNQQYQGYEQGWRGRGGAWRGRGRGRGGLPSNRNKNTLKFDNDYDFEQANTEFEELRSQLAKAKIGDDVKPEPNPVVNGGMRESGGDAEKKDDSGNETVAGEVEADEDDGFLPYDKAKSFFDNISCEAVERQKGRSQRTDWRTERKLNSETFGVASARRGAWRGRGGWRQYPQHQPWRAGGRGGGRGRGGGAMVTPAPHAGNNNRQRMPGAAQLQQPQPAAAK